MIAPEMRDLAQRLLTYEAIASNASESAEAMTLRVYEKLRQSLGVFAGAAGFYSLATRALALARSEVSSLSTLHPGRFLAALDVEFSTARSLANKTESSP